MSKRYILTLTNGMLEDVGAESIEFTPTHIVFASDNGRVLDYAIRADLVKNIVEDSE